MITYPDGTEARVGDKVSLAHGTDTGFVIEMIDSVEKVQNLNLNEMGLMIESKATGMTFYPMRSPSLNEDIRFMSRSSA